MTYRLAGARVYASVMNEAPDLMQLRIRLAASEDAQALAELCHEVHTLHLSQRPDLFKPIAFDALRAWFVDKLAHPDFNAWIAEAGSIGVGYVLVERRARAETLFTHASRWWELDQMGVAPGQRRLGVARALVEHVHATARSEGVAGLELQCYAFNDTARAAFAGLGFVPKMTRFEHPEPRRFSHGSSPPAVAGSRGVYIGSIFASSSAQREFWLGQEDLSPDQIRTLYGGLKRLLFHGDAEVARRELDKTADRVTKCIDRSKSDRSVPRTLADAGWSFASTCSRWWISWRPFGCRGRES